MIFLIQEDTLKSAGDADQCRFYMLGQVVNGLKSSLGLWSVRICKRPIGAMQQGTVSDKTNF